MIKKYNNYLIITFISTLICAVNSKTLSQTFIDDRDGQTYKVVKIGNQYWMAENLAFKPDTGNYWAYDNDQSNVEIYGYLYNWETAKNVCPAGWHLPTDAEWTILSNYLGKIDEIGCKLKEIGTIHWDSPNKGATNESGFTALPGGRCSSYPSFVDIGIFGFWWSSTWHNSTNSWYRYMHYNECYLGRTTERKEYGFSVRCLKD